MVLPAGESPVSFSQIRTEFGTDGDNATGPVRLGQYRSTDSSFSNKDVGGLLNQPLDEGIPTSGAINVDAFHDKRLNVIIDYHSAGVQDFRPSPARSKYNAISTNENRTVIGGFKDRIINDSSGSKVRIHVNKEIGSSNTNTKNCAVRTGVGWESGTILTVEIGSSGALYGAGGDGGDGGSGDSVGSGSGFRDGADGGAGSSALGIQYSGTTVINNGLIIKGYGGGGGGGYRKVEKEEWFSGPVYSAGGGGGGAGQGLPSGTAGTGSGGGGTFEVEANGSPFDVDSNNQVLQTMGIIASVDSISAVDTARIAGTYTNVSYSAQGSGTGATFNIEIASQTKAVTVNVTNGGSGYAVDDTITVNNSQLGNGTGAANLTFDVASISSLFTFKRGGSIKGTNTNGNPLTVSGGKRYVLFPENASAFKDNPSFTVADATPQQDNSPNNRVFRITEYEIVSGDNSSGGGGTASKTAGGDGGNGGERAQAHGGGGGGGGSDGTGGLGGNGNDGTDATEIAGGNGASGVNTGSVENENNVTGQGGSGGASGAAIRRKNPNIIVNVINNGTIIGTTESLGDQDDGVS